MKNTFRYIAGFISGISVLLFCVNAGANISDTLSISKMPISEPVNMLLMGLALIGFGSILRSRISKTS